MAGAGPIRLAILADTHMPRGRRALPQACVEAIRAADLVLHAGDFSERSALEQIEALNPRLTAVRGNVDSPELRRILPETATVELAGVRVAMVHDAGSAKGRLKRMRERFPDCDAVIFGHSHMPLHESEDGFQIFNPGSPTERRRSPRPSFGIAEVEAARVGFELVWIGVR